MDETLALALTKEARLEIYMREYGEKILHMVYLMTKDRVTAEDITQETFVKVYRNMGSFRGESQIHTWIYRIAVNEAKKHLRKQAAT
ncbi:sigma-70 family RNA polymerase sigma factor [Brevibacillus sp. SYP-B805]|uniref:sigma-70 family RNA polymerase sigma factor n=1 Tax=Brevibacillus sp. SYP-B805 TaxID=1578199 RepID=UPI0013E9A353|nr:sigma-70 family RNA polymerase sigma factor [Brevibacillus sp. SYP-B805]